MIPIHDKRPNAWRWAPTVLQALRLLYDVARHGWPW